MEQKTKAAINRNFEKMALRLADMNAEISKLRVSIENLDRDRLDQWKMIKDICEHLNISEPRKRKGAEG